MKRTALSRLPIRTKLALVVAIFSAVCLALLAVSVFAFEQLSAVRAYVGGEGLWSKAQKDAAHHLTRYAQSRDEREYQQFLTFLEVPLGDKAARLALQAEPPDLEAADRGFLQGRNHPDDVRSMGLLFTRFRRVSYIARAIGIWAQADQGIEELLATGDALHQHLGAGDQAGPPGELLERIAAINRRLTTLEDEFSFTLGEAARWLKTLLATAMLVITGLFLGLGVFVASAISRNVLGGIGRLREGTERLREGDLDHRIALLSHDELGQLGSAFNAMADALAAARQERARAEESLAQRAGELAEANQKLVEHERVKSKFFSNISHELRTPLSLILAPLESLLAGEYGPVSDRVTGLLGTMHNNALRLLQMVQGLLDFHKLEAGRVEVKREPTDIGALTLSLFADFQLMMKQRGIEGRVEAMPENAAVAIDRYLYERILFNLASNAAKFTPEGGTVSISLVLQGDTLTLKVKDTGIGISRTDQQSLFQRFNQVDGASTRRFEGAGLGLALVKEFAVLLGGDIAVDSRLGQGSTFTLSCLAPPVALGAGEAGRLASREHASLVEQHPAAVPADEELAVGGPLGDQRLLLVEDNAELAAYITRLTSPLCQTRIARDGDEALRLVSEWKPNLIISDVMMPGRDGLSVCREVKANELTREIPFVLLTALTYRDALLRGWEAGADDYLFKPFHPAELLTRVRTLLATHRTINEHKTARLRSEQQLAALLRGQSELGEGFALLEAGTRRLLFINDALCLILGRSREEILTSRFDTWTALAFDSAPDGQFERSLVRADGSVVVLQLSMKRVETAGEDRIVALVRDVTDSKIMQRRLHVTERLASVGMLASAVAHEINNPLSFILSNLAWASQTLEETGAQGPLFEAVGKAQEGARRVRDVVRDLKTFSRPEKDNRTRVDVRYVLDSSVNMALIQFPRPPRITRRYAREALVEASESRLGQVFLNLIINAIQSLPETSRDRDQLVLTTQVDHDQLTVEIRDSGVGIPPEVMPRILEPFFTTKPEGVGTGLGLSISNEIVTSLGGTLTVESEVGHGTCVKVRLPVSPHKEPQPTPRAQAALRQRRASIMFIDDEPLVVMAFEQLVAPAHDVLGLTDAQQAVELLKNGASFDVIICDLMMPKMSGMEFREAVKVVAPHLLERLYFSTGGVFTSEGIRFLNQQVNQVVDKPFDGDQLQAIVAASLQRVDGAVTASPRRGPSG